MMISFFRGENFYGLPVITASNGEIELDVLEAAGPRIIRLRSRLIARENLLAETPDQCIPTPHGEYRVFGGHRLQTAPETSPSTYIPDGRPVQIIELADGLEISGQVEPETGLSRKLTVKFQDSQGQITIQHCLSNHGQTPVPLSAWCLTMFPPGGRIIMPLRKASENSSILPDRSLVFWPYSKLQTDRFSLTEKTAILAPSADHTPFKFGGLAEWLAYELNDLIFVKTFATKDDLPYPDRGCSAEVYANGDFVELESLSPLMKLEPGQSISHVEEWALMDKKSFSEFLSTY